MMIHIHQKASLCLSVTRWPQEGAIWGAGVGMAFDGHYIYAATANNDRSGAF